jgi:ubiquinone/menaquinone biosynthesis C-methylase UbiE
MNDSIFNEAEYLAANPDVAAAVRDGKFRSGYQHYKIYGQREGRILSPKEGLLNLLNPQKTYKKLSENLRENELSHDRVMQKAIGGVFDGAGLIEKDLLIQHGLKSNNYLIDVGCGSGRLAIPLSKYLPGMKYLGTDVVKEFLDYAEAKIKNRNFRFELTAGSTIPESDNCVDMICFFSVFTHLLHEQTYTYLIEAKRVLKPNGKIIFSFLEFSIPCHWKFFEKSYKDLSFLNPLNMFIGRDAIQAWADHLGLTIEGIYDGDKSHIKLLEPITLEDGNMFTDSGSLDQSVCVMRK